MNYEIHNTYPFVAEGIIEGKNEKKYIALRRAGEDKVSQFAPAYDFQTEWVDKFPCKMWCEVMDYNADKDICILQQCYYDLLSSLYSGLPQTNKFKVVNSKIDSNTNNNFYILKDAYGLCHRFYSNHNETYNIGDEVEMLVESVVQRDNRHGYLSLCLPKAQAIDKKDNSGSAPSNEDPRTTSRFGCENDNTEFKSSIVFTPADVNPKIDEQIKTIMKTIAGFMNKDGGTLYLGVNDAGVICGIESDFKYLNSSETDRYTYHQNQDGYELKIRESIKRHLTSANLGNLLTLTFVSEDDKTYCIAEIKQSKYPVFFNGNKLYQRMGNQTNMLKDFEIYLFIEDRISRFGAQNQPTDTEDTTASEYNAPEAKPSSIVTEDQKEEEKKADEATKLKITKPTLTPWRYIRLYTGGRWSYGKKPTKDTTDLVREIILPKEKNGKKENRLMIVYKNGCVASVLIGNIKPAKEDYIYSNGWKSDTEILDAFVANEHESIAYRSETTDGEQWNKLHYSCDISDQEKMGGKGNKVVNDLLGATITNVALVPTDFLSRLDSYRVKANQTSSSLGFKRSDPSFRDSLHLIDAIFE